MPLWAARPHAWCTAQGVVRWADTTAVVKANGNEPGDMTEYQSVHFPDCPAPLVSIVVVGFGDAPHLLACLRSVMASVRLIEYEVIVVLNGADDSVRSGLGRHVNGARVVESASTGVSQAPATWGPRLFEGSSSPS